MIARDDTGIFVAFGKLSSPDTALRNEGRTLSVQRGRLGRQIALIREGTGAFRLNSPGWTDPPPELVAALTDRSALRLFCRDRLLAATPPFAAKARSHILAYLDRLEKESGSPPADMSDAVIHPADHFFAALLPFPKVHIAPVSFRNDSPVLVEPNAYARADLAFWDGTTLTAICFGSLSTLTPRQRNVYEHILDRLAPSLQFVWIEGYETSADTVPATVYDAWKAAEPPWFGPYRAAGFQTDLPPELLQT